MSMTSNYADATRGDIACECGHQIANHDDQTRPGYPDGGRCQVMVSPTEQCPCSAARILTPEVRARLAMAARVEAAIRAATW